MKVTHNISPDDPEYYEYVFECEAKHRFNPPDTEYYYIRNCGDRQTKMIEEMGYFYKTDTRHGQVSFIIFPFGTTLTGEEIEMNRLLGVYIPEQELHEEYPYICEIL